MNLCVFSTHLHVYHHISHLHCISHMHQSHKLCSNLMFIDGWSSATFAPSSFYRASISKIQGFPSAPLIATIHPRFQWEKNWTRLIQTPPHYGAYSIISAMKLVAEWKNDGYLRLPSTFWGRSWKFGGLKSRVWKKNCLMANQAVDIGSQYVKRYRYINGP